mmetsp:Transcript_27008/g.79803  ORF Transcript_27008/g.79803 Transcript_27008/m.79803 type:complete len:282 (-) Transcript_27008:621-1466(-)|eukprot:CAMPEP_0113544734 /NCGR_PEP_ID=MMETSP0015_2-20120614/10868_1 /TAXON_ID=2838 /ORGANISM="Odontella" /LENGTH=281 /DNA_ID=CAMNT_0000445017 /DNA_START=380 /DNA_END=1225 /DNA_ORIENTATION=+ /assembly_acc=CAM_ASM_000160
MAICDLPCENGGYCSLLPGDKKELSNRAAAGDLLEKCVCRPGYEGTTCELAVEECSDFESVRQQTCRSGVPCKRIAIAGSGIARYGCDCGVAMSVSRFAYEMCRQPATEYCGRSNSIQANSFCTNGGSCAGNLGLRKVDKGPFQHEGCVCPPEFHGPHCEYLIGHGPSQDSSAGRITPSSSPVVLDGRGGPGSVFVTAMILFGLGAAIVSTTAIVFQARRRKQVREETEWTRELQRREMSLKEDPSSVAETVTPYSDDPPPNNESSDENSSSPYKCEAIIP